MKEYITLWANKGHTKKNVPIADICDNHFWKPEYYDSNAEYIALINPTLKSIGNTKKFCAAISISHKSITYNGRMYVRAPKGSPSRWIIQPDCKIGMIVLCGDVEDSLNFNIHSYGSDTKLVSDWMLKEAIDVFFSARDKFMSIFSRNENLDNT